MIKKILVSLVLIALTAYLIMVPIMFTEPDTTAKCNKMEVVVDSDSPVSFINEKEIRNLLKKGRLCPEGKLMNDVNTRLIEKSLMQNPFISKANCFKTNENSIRIEVTQRLPLVHIITSNSNYYLDQDGTIMPSNYYAANMIVATGQISNQFAKEHLVPLVSYIMNDPFWQQQIQQINVATNGEVEMIPLVGEQVLFIGRTKDYENKLKRLKDFYMKAMNDVGWNKYKRINVEFDNQIICTKK